MKHVLNQCGRSYLELITSTTKRAKCSSGFFYNLASNEQSLTSYDLVYFTTRVPDMSDTSVTRTTRVRQKRHKCNTSATQVWHECYTNDTSAKRMRIFDFDNDTSEKIFSHPYISYMANERWNNFILRTTFWEMPRSHANMHLKSTPQKLNFVMAKAISKSYTLDCSCKCSCTFPHSYA